MNGASRDDFVKQGELHTGGHRVPPEALQRLLLRRCTRGQAQAGHTAAVCDALSSFIGKKIKFPTPIPLLNATSHVGRKVCLAARLTELQLLLPSGRTLQFFVLCEFCLPAGAKQLIYSAKKKSLQSLHPQFLRGKQVLTSSLACCIKQPVPVRRSGGAF